MESTPLPDDYQSDLANLQSSARRIIDSAEQLGELKARYAFFEALRALMLEKDQVNDETAVSILTWAYGRLADAIPVE